MSRIPVPDDWDVELDGYVIGLLCIPNSVSWRAVARGAIHGLTRGRHWDGDTGIINDAIAIAAAISEDFCMTTCEDIVIALEGANNTELTKAVKELTTLLGSLNRNIASDLPDVADYSAIGLDKRLDEIRVILAAHLTSVDEIEEITQEVARAIGGVTVPIAT